MSLIAQGARDAIVAYIRAKDENRAHLARFAFHDAAILSMVVKTDAISFPPGAAGRDAITDVLVRDFGQAYENVRTFCLSSPPEGEHTAFSCGWLVGMSAKENRIVRVGCGRYDWLFDAQSPHLAKKLTITIEVMQLLPADTVSSVMEWLDQLPYPGVRGKRHPSVRRRSKASAPFVAGFHVRTPNHSLNRTARRRRLRAVRSRPVSLVR